MGYVGVGTAWGFKKQSAFGTPSVVDKWIPFVSESTAKNYEMLEIVDSESRHKRDMKPLGRIAVEGDINTYVEPENVGYPLYFLMGSAPAPTNVTGSVYKHTFDVANEIPYFTMEMMYGTLTTKAKRAYDCKMKGATFDFAEDILAVTWNVHGADYSGAVTDPATITYPKKRKYTFKDSTVDITPDGASAETGVKIKSGQLQIDNGLITDDYYQGNQKVQQLDAGKFSVKGSFELILSSGTALDGWFNGDKSAEFKVTYAGDTISGTNKYDLVFIVPNAWVNSHSTNMTQNEVITRQVEFEGFYDPDDTPKTLRITLQNTGSAAYSA